MDGSGAGRELQAEKLRSQSCRSLEEGPESAMKVRSSFGASRWFLFTFLAAVSSLVAEGKC